jgi:hypothetical protein
MANASNPGAVPAAGYVADHSAAMRVAEAAWKLIYGENELGNAARYSIKLKNGVWNVKRAPLEVEGGNTRSKTSGTFTAEIVQADGRVLSTDHER